MDVSVIIPAYESSLFIARTLASVFAQTHTGFEVIVVNDGSPDTDALLQAIEPWRERLVYLSQPNAGAGAARNAGISAAHGRYLAFLDADDLWREDFLERQLGFLAAHPEVDLVYCDALLAGDSPLAGRRFMDTAPSDGEVTLEALITQRCTVLTSGVMTKRTAVASAGLFDPAIRRGQDFDLWLRLAHAGYRLAYQREPLVTRQIHADSLSGDAVAELERARHVLEALPRKVPLIAATRDALERRVRTLRAATELERGKQRFRDRDFAGARRHLRASAALALRWKLRAAVLALTLVPRLLHRVYVRQHPRGMSPGPRISPSGA